MNRTQYEARIAMLEVEAQRNPRVIRSRFVFHLIACYLLIFATPLVFFAFAVGSIFVAGTVGSVGLSFLVIAALFIVAIASLVAAFKTLFISADKYEGTVLLRKDAPQFFSLLDDISSNMRTRSCNKIFIESPMNAGVYITIGRAKDEIIFGLPLLFALSPRHLTSIIAHEQAHLTKNQRSISRLTTRVLSSWNLFLHELDKKPETSRSLFVLIITQLLNIPNSMFSSFWSSLAPQAFVIDRLNEIEADQAAAEYADAKIYAQTLVLIYAIQRLLDKYFWTTLDEMVAEGQPAPVDLFSRMQRFLEMERSEAELVDILQEELAKKSNCLDVHPSLADRLSACGFTPSHDGERWNILHELFPIESSRESAARAFIPEEVLSSLIEHLNADWLKRVKPVWEHQTSRMNDAREILTELNQDEEELDADQLLERALATLNLSGEEAAVPLFHKIIGKYPDHAGSHFLLGRILLNRKDQSGIQHLNRVMELDIDLALHACRLVQEFCILQGNPQLADEYSVWEQKTINLLKQSERERCYFLPKDKYIAHDWSEEDLEKLRGQLAAFTKISHAYLVKKEVKLFPEKPCYVIGVAPFRPCRWFDGGGNKIPYQIAQQVSVGKKYYVVELVGQYYKLDKKMSMIPHSLVYQRPRK